MNIMRSFRTAFRGFFDFIGDRMMVMRRVISPISSSGVLVNRVTAMQSAVYSRCVQVLAGDISSLSLKLYRSTADGGKTEARDHPDWPIWTVAPNAHQSRQRWVETLMGQLLRWGNAYCEIVMRPDQSIIELNPILPICIRPRATYLNQIVYEYDTPNGSQFASPGQVLHFRAFSEDGVIGLDPLTQLTQALGLSVAAEGYGAGFFRNNGTPSGALKYPGVLSDTDFEAIKQSWNRNHSGPENWHKMTILDRGLEWQAFGIDAEKAQLLATRKYQRSEIAGWFGVPLHRLMDLERATFSNIEQQGIEYVVYSLTPWLVRLEQEVNRVFYPRGDVFVEFNAASLLRGDAAARAAYYKELFYLGCLTINEIRRRENLNPIGPIGDVHWMQQNMTTAERAAEPPKPPPPMLPGSPFGKPPQMGEPDGDEVDDTEGDDAEADDNGDAKQRNLPGMLATQLAAAIRLALPAPDGDAEAAGVAHRMAGLLADNHEARDWTTRQWAEALECSPSTVQRTPIWRGLMAGRERERQRRMVDSD